MGKASGLDSETKDKDFSYRLRIGNIEGKGDTDMIRAIFDAGFTAGKSSILP